MQPTLRLVASLALLQATLVSCSVASPPQGTLLTSSSSAGSAQQSPASSNHVKYIHVPYKAASSAVSGSLSAKLLDRLSQLLTLALPTLDDAHASAWGDEFESIPDSGLFGSGDPTFAWGGSTLEVVVSTGGKIRCGDVEGCAVEWWRGEMSCEQTRGAPSDMGAHTFSAFNVQ